MLVYDVGDDALLTATFRTVSGNTAVDPTAIFLKVMLPDLSITTYEYGVGDEITRTGTGIYTFTQSCDTAGLYQYRWYSTGTGKAAQESSFQVRLSAFS